MTAADIAEVLGEAASEVLETMFFAELAGEAPPPAGGLAARLEFRGSPPGAFAVALQSGLARNFASSFLAVDEGEITVPQAEEVVCELANMICGSVLSRLGPNASFELLKPVIVPAGSTTGISRSFDCGGSAVAMWIDLRPNS